MSSSETELVGSSVYQQSPMLAVSPSQGDAESAAPYSKGMLARPFPPAPSNFPKAPTPPIPMSIPSTSISRPSPPPIPPPIPPAKSKSTSDSIPQNSLKKASSERTALYSSVYHSPSQSTNSSSDPSKISGVPTDSLPSPATSSLTMPKLPAVPSSVPGQRRVSYLQSVQQE